MKKLLSVLMVAVMAVSMLAGCGAEAEGDGMKIAIVSSPSGVDDGSFNQNNYDVFPFGHCLEFKLFQRVFDG